MEIKKILISILAIILLLPSCKTPDVEVSSTTVTTVPPEKVFPATALFEEPEPNEAFLEIKTRYTDAQLTEIANFEGDLNAFNNKFPIEYYTYSEVSGYYWVLYRGENEKIAIITFDESGQRFTLVGWGVINLSCSIYEFATIEKGMTLAEVEKIDPNGTYYPLYGSGSERDSSHYTPEGYSVTIYYEKISNQDIPYKERLLVVDIEISIP